MRTMELNNAKDFEMTFEYKMYIKSEPWKIIREMCLIRAGFMCEKCGKIGKQMGGNSTLHVHHKTYARFGCEDMDDLIVVCKNCHSNIHRLKKYNIEI